MHSFLPNNYVVTGRGASAIYMVLSNLAPSLDWPGVLIAPANVCYAALYPALYAGWSIRFVDVSADDGNLTAAGVEGALSAGDASALLAPHMYGQPISELPAIASVCRSANVTLIEDCASCMGATASYPVGKVGDYAVYSTGYAKVVDVGFGGLLASETDPLDWTAEIDETLPLLTEELEQTENLFSKVYRTLRSFPDNNLDQAIYRTLPEATRDLFLHRLAADDKQHVLDALADLDDIVAFRRACQTECMRLWEQEAPAGARAYPYRDGAVPWRFTFLVEPSVRKPLVGTCLDAGVPISDWYPSIAPMLGDLGSYPAAEAMGDAILNLPLTDETVEAHLPKTLELLAHLQEG